MTMQKGQQPERRLLQADIDRIWELYFGKKWSLRRIAIEYEMGAAHTDNVASIIDTESARRWGKNHPNETNREMLVE